MSRELVADVKLTLLEENFCQNLLKGLPQYEAYVQAGYSPNQAISTLYENASRLANSSKVKARMLELYNMTAEPVIMDVKKRKKRLSDIAQEEIIQKNGIPIRTWNLQAITELNKMDGSYKVEQSNNQTIINIIVPDKETKNLLNGVVDNTRVIETGYKLLPEQSPDAPE